MKSIDADALNKELDIISKRSEFGEMSLIPIRDFRIIMNRVNADTLNKSVEERRDT